MFWRCPSCEGRMMTLAYLRRKLQRDFVNALWQKARNNKEQRKRDCPVCQKKMVETMTPATDRGLLLDVCLNCQSVWFDPTEYEQAPEIPKASLKLGLKDPLVKQPAKEVSSSWEAPSMGRAPVLPEDLPEEFWKLIPGIFGLPVENETAVRTRQPLATWSLAASILVISLLAFLDFDRTVMTWGYIPAEWLRYGGLTLLSSFFLHGGLFHLIGNLYFLLVFGDNVEETLGIGMFLLMLLLATVAGDLTHLLFDPNSLIPTIGASGGISAVITFYALKFPKARLSVGFFFAYYFRWITLSALGMFVIWVVIQVIGAAMQLQGSSGVSYAAHLGGVYVGFMFWWMFRHK